tara:strand:+ start:669 stop:842 length:174 start_codon:yes stop_codon:yes gene_type:complete
MRQFKPKESEELSKSGGVSRYSYRERQAYHAEKRMLVRKNEALREKQKKIPSQKWFE